MEVFNLDLIPGRSNPVIHCSQFDEGRSYRANLFEGASVYTLDGTETITLIEKKLDGNEVTIGVTNTSDSYVEFSTTQQLTALAGPQLCELRFEKGADLIGSANFILDCEESPDTGITSDSAIHNLEEQIAEAVADQYDSNNVIFDNAPTPGHGVGYCVTSEGTPDELADLTDVELTAPAIGEALVYDGTKFVNGTVSTVGSIDDLNDVDTTGKAEGDSLRYDSGSGDWVAKPIVIEVTQAEYDQLVLDGDLQPLTTYVITDAPNLNATAKDISYEGSTDTVWDKVESLKTDALTCTGSTGVTVAYCTGGKNDKLVCGSIALDKSWSSGWNNGVATLNFKPSAIMSIVALNATNGGFYGMASIDTSGNVNVYVTGTAASIRVALTFAFTTA